MPRLPENPPTMQRRHLLTQLGRGAAALALGSLFTPGQGRVRIERLPGADDPFTLGVASGMPGPDRVLLWTRLAPQPMLLLLVCQFR